MEFYNGAEGYENTKVKALEQLASNYTVNDPVSFSSEYLHGDLLEDVYRRLVSESQHQGIITLYGNYRSGKTSLLRSLEQHFTPQEYGFVDIHAHLYKGVKGIHDYIVRRSDSNILALDEIGSIKEKTDYYNLLSQLLKENRTLILTVMMGSERHIQRHRYLARELNLSHTIVTTFSQSSHEDLLVRLEHTVNRVLNVVKTGYYGSSLASLTFAPDVWEEIARITAFRPREVNGLLQAFFEHMSVHNPNISTVSGIDIRNYFNEQIVNGPHFKPTTVDEISKNQTGSHYRIRSLYDRPSDYSAQSPEELFHRFPTYVLLSKIIRDIPVEPSVKNKALLRSMLELGFVEIVDNRFQLRGEWLKDSLQKAIINDWVS
ncbi:hypothetical protein HGA88_05930 [Candidatus Roizmanbacteria bacterium]|nr:hypothetical protein [Candidatus Roizmanbacteria bacterium]